MLPLPSAADPKWLHQRRALARLPHGQAALVIGHPGHELRVYGWLERVCPRVFLLTDGSGHTGRARSGLTLDLLRQAGARPGLLFGSFADALLYQALLDHRVDLFWRWAEDLAAALVREQITYVVGDAADGYNPGHDVCRLLIDTAVAVVRRTTGRRLRNYDFPLVETAAAGTDGGSRPELTLELTEGEFERKLAAARNYGPLKAEVARAIARAGLAAFRRECLRPVPGRGGLPQSVEPPAYEHYGEQRVATGHYRQVLRYRQHLAPLAEGLRRRLEDLASCAACAC